MQTLYNFFSLCMEFLYYAVTRGALVMLVFWIIRSLVRKDHPHYKTDETGKVYCPAIREMLEIKRAIRIIRITGRDPRHQELPAAKSPISISKEIQELAKLKQDGVLTDEEFNIQKQKLLKS